MEAALRGLVVYKDPEFHSQANPRHRSTPAIKSIKYLSCTFLNFTAYLALTFPAPCALSKLLPSHIIITMRVSAQIIAALALAAGTANASLYRRAHDASAASAVSTTLTETATITSPSATSTGGAHPLKHDHDTASTETETSTATTTESHATGAARPAQTSVSLIKGSPAAASSAAASPSAAAAGNSTASYSRPKAAGTGDYVGYVDHSAEPSSGSHKTGSGSGSGGSSNDEGEASPKPTKALHTSPGSNLVVPGLAAIGSLAVGLMVLV
jgi:hypothetical protein